MRYLTKTLDFDSRGDSVVTLGKFDGLHRGHMLLIRRVLAIGRTEGLETVVFTFDVPPQSKVQHVKPHQLLTNEERRARLEQLGMDCLVECPFVDEVMHMTPEAFIKEILVDKLHAKKVVVGKDFGFGAQHKCLNKWARPLVFNPRSPKNQNKTAARSAAPGHGKSWNRAIWKP